MHFDGASLAVGFLLGWICSGTLLMLVGQFKLDHLPHKSKSTPWEPSHFDPDVEVRWRDGVVESRLKPKEPQF